MSNFETETDLFDKTWFWLKFLGLWKFLFFCTSQIFMLFYKQKIRNFLLSIWWFMYFNIVDIKSLPICMWLGWQMPNVKYSAEHKRGIFFSVVKKLLKRKSSDVVHRNILKSRSTHGKGKHIAFSLSKISNENTSHVKMKKMSKLLSIVLVVWLASNSEAIPQGAVKPGKNGSFLTMYIKKVENMDIDWIKKNHFIFPCFKINPFYIIVTSKIKKTVIFFQFCIISRIKVRFFCKINNTI